MYGGMQVEEGGIQCALAVSVPINSHSRLPQRVPFIAVLLAQLLEAQHAAPGCHPDSLQVWRRMVVTGNHCRDRPHFHLPAWRCLRYIREGLAVTPEQRIGQDRQRYTKLTETVGLKAQKGIDLPGALWNGASQRSSRYTRSCDLGQQP